MRPTTASCWIEQHGAASNCASCWPPPSRAEATRFLETLRGRLGGELGLAPRTLADRLAGACYVELEQFAQDVRRRYVLALPDGDLGAIVPGPTRRAAGRAALTDAATDPDPDPVVVFDLAGSVQGFTRAVTGVPGLEFLAELEVTERCESGVRRKDPGLPHESHRVHDDAAFDHLALAEVVDGPRLDRDSDLRD